MDDQIKGFSVNAQGYGTIPKAVMQDQCISIMAKAVYAYFCSFTGAGDSCFPSQQKICSDLEVSKNSLNKYIRELKEAGFLEVEQEKTNGRFSRNIYTLTDAKLPYTKISDTEDLGNQNLNTKNNSIKNNSIIKKNSNKKSMSDKPTQPRFIKPTVDEVKAYCEERNNNVDAERFVDYYTANGWKVGKNPMKDWKATVRTWEKGEKKKNAEPEQLPEQQHYGIVL